MAPSCVIPYNGAEHCSRVILGCKSDTAGQRRNKELGTSAQNGEERVTEEFKCTGAYTSHCSGARWTVKT